MSGRVRSTAKDTDRADKILNDRVLEVLTVVMGWVVPFNEAYNGRVEDEVNAKAIVAIVGRKISCVMCEQRRKDILIPSQKVPSRIQSELARRAPCECAWVTHPSHAT